MKHYSDPVIEVVNFDITDITNFGQENEISAGALFGSISIDW